MVRFSADALNRFDVPALPMACRWTTLVLAVLMVVGCAPASSQPQIDVVAPQTLSLAEVTSRAKVAQALAHIEAHREAGLGELIKLNETPAPPFGEAQRGVLFAKMLEGTGFGPVHTDEVGNVISVRRGGRGSGVVAVLAHLDTVFPADTDVRVKVDGNLYRAPGIGDNTRGLVLLLELARAFVATELQTDSDIWLVGNVGEEGLGDLRGARHLFREGAPPIDAMIAIDGGNAGRLVTDAVGSNRFRVTFGGPGGHSWGDFGLVSPHHALGTAIKLFVERAKPLVANGPRTSFNVGRIGGGTSVNSIAFESWMEVDMRSVDAGRLEALTQTFKTAMRETLSQQNESGGNDGVLTLELKPIGERPAGGVDRSAPLVQYAAAALREVGIEPTFVASSTDANVPMSLGIPAVTMSRGGVSKRAHSLDESWEDRDTHLATQAVLLTLVAVTSDF
ncbi:MAG: M20/M25/M40 family metallo-hydrolase [Gammaproteobacteria bacterium]